MPSQDHRVSLGWLCVKPATATWDLIEAYYPAISNSSYMGMFQGSWKSTLHTGFCSSGITWSGDRHERDGHEAHSWGKSMHPAVTLKMGRGSAWRIVHGDRLGERRVREGMSPLASAPIHWLIWNWCANGKNNREGTQWGHCWKICAIKERWCSTQKYWRWLVTLSSAIPLLQVFTFNLYHQNTNNSAKRT